MSVFHLGEQQVQAKLGLQQRAASAAKYIRGLMPEQHRLFFSQQAILYLGLLDDNGHPWASPVFDYAGGPDDLVSSPNAGTLIIEAKPLLAFSGRVQLRVGDKLGLLGLEFTTRRRNRANGVLSYLNDGLMRFAVEQSFGNCPKYIHTRRVSRYSVHTSREPGISANEFSSQPGLDTHVVAMLERCDSFFIASRTPMLNDVPQAGLDVSHRGGQPGFIKVLDGKQLLFPDFSGNNFYNTLGNITLDPRVGLYIPDFIQGHSVWLKGRAEIIWDELDNYRYPGAQRYVLVSIEETLILAGTGLRQTGPTEFSPVTDHLAQWQ